MPALAHVCVQRAIACVACSHLRTCVLSFALAGRLFRPFATFSDFNRPPPLFQTATVPPVRAQVSKRKPDISSGRACETSFF